MENRIPPTSDSEPVSSLSGDEEGNRFWQWTKDEIKKNLSHVAIHAVTMAAALLSLYFVGKLLDYLLGHDFKLLGLLPLRYLLEAGDILMILKLIYHLIFPSGLKRRH